MTYLQFLTVTLDNASNNVTMVRELAELIDGFPGLPNMVRCFAHTLNLAARAVMRLFDTPTGKEDAARYDGRP